MKRLATLSAAMLLIAAVFATCGPPEVEQPPDEVTVRLKWVHQAQFAGMYVAVEKGFYKDRDLAACRKSDAQQAISKHNRKIKDTLHSR